MAPFSLLCHLNHRTHWGPSLAHNGKPVADADTLVLAAVYIHGVAAAKVILVIGLLSRISWIPSALFCR